MVPQRIQTEGGGCHHPQSSPSFLATDGPKYHFLYDSGHVSSLGSISWVIANV